MKNILIGGTLIIAAALSRLLPHPPNVAPIAAMALAGGVYLNKRWGLLIPLAAMLLSDAIIGFHGLMPYVYGSFVMIAFIGLWLKAHPSVVTVVGGTLASSILFFVVTNFGVWAADGGVFYPQSLAGLTECYVAAIPFFRNTLLGDAVYTGVLFGAFEVAGRYFHAFQHSPEFTR